MDSLRAVAIWMAALALAAPLPSEAAGQVTAAEARAIAAEAYTYGFPLVDNYRIMYDYWVDKGAREYKGAINTVQSSATVYGPEDKAIQTPNSDTPYSYSWLDLRAEPIVLTLPAIEKGRYYSAQLIDGYTYNFAYLGTRSTGNSGGAFAIAGPGWKGQTPKGVKRLIRADTNFVFVLYRTQLLKPDDLENVQRIQAGYQAQPLSAFLGRPAPKSAAPMDFPKPLTAEAQKSSLDFFKTLNFALGMSPSLAEEQKLMARFARIDVGPGKAFSPEKFSPEVRTAMQEGIADAWKGFAALQKQVDTGKVASGDLFGTRPYLGSNYLYRFGGAVLGIYGNSRQEAIYPAYFVDATGEPLDASKSNYVLRFGRDQLPPVDAFWSLTMYGLPGRLLVANPVNRYLVNSPMLPSLKRDADGAITLYLQSTSPGADKDSNWLPTPHGPFFTLLRLYLPQQAATDGIWKQPPLRKAP